MFSYARALPFVVAFALIFHPLLSAPSADAAESSSAGFRNARSDVNAAGRRKTSTTYREDASVGALSLTTATSASYLGRGGLIVGYHYPARVTDLFSSSAAVSGTISLQWTAPGNDGSETSTAGRFIVRYSSLAAESPAISDAKFNAAADVTPAPPAPSVKGTRQTMTATGLSAGVTYYFAIKTAERDGTRAVLSAGATAQTVPPLGCVIARNVHKVDGPYFDIQSAVNALPSILSAHSCVIVRDGATYGEQVTVRNFTNNGSSITIMADPASGLTPIVSPPLNSTAAFQIANASVNVLGISIVASQSIPYGVWASSAYVTLSSVSVSTSGSLGIYTAGVRISSWSVISYSSVTVWNAHGYWLDGSTMTAVSFSTAVNNAANSRAVYLDGGKNNAFTVIFASNSHASGTGLYALGSDTNTVTQSWIWGGNNGVNLATGSDYNTISLSTMISNSAGNPALYVLAGSSNAIFNSYVQGSTAVYLSGSTGTVIGGSVLVATNTAGSALQMGGGSVNLTLSSSTLTAGSSGAGVYLDNNNKGRIVLSTNTLSGAQYGVLIATQMAGTQIFITSNTITVSTGSNAGGAATYGLYLNGLLTGATITNNAIVYRTSGGLGGAASYGFYANTVAGINFDHNRISNPGMITGGSFYGAYLTDADNVAFKLNDVYSTAPALAAAFLVRAGEGSTGLALKDNIFFSSFTAPGASNSSGTLSIADAASQTGFASDYNDFFSSNAAMGFQWGTSGAQGFAAWKTASSKDANSISAHPLWASLESGTEDFHPRSLTGRWDPAAQAFVIDGAASPTIDAGDPAEAYALEPSPNGGRANQGSYGNTAEASKPSATAMSWVGGCDNNWYTSACWSPVRVPTELDAVTINLNGAGVKVNASSPTIVFESLALGNAGGTNLVSLTVSTSILGSGSLTINKGSGLTSRTTSRHQLGSVTMLSGSSMTHALNGASALYTLDMRVTGGFDVQAGATVTVSSAGYSVLNGPGNPTVTFNLSGGAYGGQGGCGNLLGSIGCHSAELYGSYSAPTDLGSGSGNYLGGGSGGGAVILDIAGALTLNGRITADGMTANEGGSGGSVFLTVGSLVGGGTVTANGGDATGYGTGGGGRIAVIGSTSSFTGAFQAFAADNGDQSGGAGTVFIKPPGMSGNLIVDNNNIASSILRSAMIGVGDYTTAFNEIRLNRRGNLWLAQSSTISLNGANILGDGTTGYLRVDGALQMSADYTLSGFGLNLSSMTNFSSASSLIVGGAKGAVITHEWNSTTEVHKASFSVANLTISAGSRIDVSSRGYVVSAGPGYPASVNIGGGAHGGQGGCGINLGSTLCSSAAPYGSYSAPTALGSGGGAGSFGNAGGGGAVILNIPGTMTLNGTIRADGMTGNTGGSGGSVFLTVGALVGGGTVTAGGGNASLYAGGGGGRIAVIGSTSSFTGGLQAFAANEGDTSGGAGTVFVKPPGMSGNLIVDNNNIAPSSVLRSAMIGVGDYTTAFNEIRLNRRGNLWLAQFSTISLNGANILGDGTTGYLRVDGALQMGADYTLSGFGLNLSSMTNFSSASSLTVGGAKGAVITHEWNSTTEVHKASFSVANLTISAGSRIDVSSKGYTVASGPGAAVSVNTGGGAHGGQGGCNSSSCPTEVPYGSYSAPTALGSGGGAGSFGNAGGGGAVILNVPGTMTLNGTIRADGMTGNTGGSGGSVFLTVGALVGGGTVTAGGGNASLYAGGGGGRIAVIGSTSSFTGGLQAFAANEGDTSGGAGTVFVKPPGMSGNLIVDNNNIAPSSVLRSAMIGVGDYTTAFNEIRLNRRGNLWLAQFSTISLNGANILGDGTTGYLRVDGALQMGADYTLSGFGLNLSSMTNFSSASSLTVGGAKGAVITHEWNSTTEVHKASFSVANLTISAGSRIDVSSRGYAAGSGSGSPGGSFDGGAHGGQGGCNNPAACSAAGGPYGSYSAPTSLGSGGGSSGGSGAKGGGAVILNVPGTLTLNGTIRADGMSSTTGGSGGSVFLTAGALVGGGTVTAGGGGASPYAGGGGGRIAVIGSTSSFTGGFQAFPASVGNLSGGAGTVFVKPPGMSGNLILDGNNVVSVTAPRYTGILAGSHAFDAISAVRKSSAAFLGFSTVTILGENAFCDGDFTSTVSVSGKAYGGTFYGVTGTAIGVRWGGSGNPGNVGYTAQLATAADFSVGLVSSTTYNRSALFTGLSTLTTYYARVAANGYSILRSTAAGTFYVSVGSVSTTLAWDDPAGCSEVKNVAKQGGQHTFIQAALDALPKSRPTTTCVVVRDTQTYIEQVTVQGFTFSYSSDTLKIMSDPSFVSSAPVVSPPPASTAAFRIANASVNVMGIGIVASQNVPYGVWASSAYVQLSSVSVSTSGSLGIYEAGVRISSRSVISYSSVTVWDAHGIWLDGSTMTAVSFSTAVNASAGFIATGRYPVYLDGGANNMFAVIFASNSHAQGIGLYVFGTDTNTVTQSYIWGGSYGVALDNGSHDNAISLSTMIGNGWEGLYLYDSRSNTVTQSYIWGGGHGVALDNGSHYNAISLSTMIGIDPSNGSGLYALGADSNTVTRSYMRGYTGVKLSGGSDFNTISLSTMIADYDGLRLSGSDSNTVTQSYLWGEAYGADFDTGADYNAISLSTMIGNTWEAIFIADAVSNTVTQSSLRGNTNGVYLDNGSNYNTVSFSTVIGSNGSGLYFDAANSNAVTQSYMWGGGGDGVSLHTGSAYNAISFSTMIGDSGQGLFITASDSNTVTQSYMWGGAGSDGASLQSGADCNAIVLSTMIANVGGAGLAVGDSDLNTVSQSYMRGVNYGASIYSADYNSVSLSTMISDSAGNPALYIAAGSSSLIFNSYVQGSTAALIAGSMGTVIRGTVFVATNTFGAALAFKDGSVNLTLATSTLISPSSGRGLALNAGNAGVVSIGSVTFSGSARGIEISTQAAGFVLAIDSVTFRNLAAGATAIHFLSSTFVSTINLANFEDANIGANVSGAALTLNSRITMTGHYGLRTGSTYENDPNGLVDWQGAAAYPGCVVTKNVGAGQAFALISDAVANLKANNNPLTGHSCIVIRDGAAYADKVTVEGFTNNGSSISIFTDPAVGSRAIINPPLASTAAFRIANASVNVMGIGIVASQNVPYGVWASSAYVQLSSVSVSTSGSLGIYEAGVRISSWSVISYSSVTVWDAHGIWLDGSTMTAVSYSTAVNKSAGRSAVYLDGGTNNAFTAIFANNSHASLGRGLLARGAVSNTVTRSSLWGNYGVYMQAGSDYNAISMSTMIGNSYFGLWISGSDSNTVTQSYMWGGAYGAFLESGADYNAISLSTMIGNSDVGLFADGSDSNTVTQGYMRGGAQGAVLFSGADYNAISLSTMIGISDAGVYASGSDSNSVTQSYMWGGLEGAVLDTGSDYNAVSFSTMIGNSAGGAGLYAGGADSNRVTQSYMWGGYVGVDVAAGADENTISLSTMIGNSGEGLYVEGADSNTVTQSFMWGGLEGAQLYIGSDYNTISLSTMIGIAWSGLDIYGSDSNTVTQSYIWSDQVGAIVELGADYNTISLSTMISNAAQGFYADRADSNTVTRSYMWGGLAGAYLDAGSDYNTISLSTMISDSAAWPTLHIIENSSNTILNSYVQGSTAALISGSTGTVIRGTVFVATNTFGSALAFADGSVNLTLATSTLISPAQGRGLALNVGNKGIVSIGSVTFSGSARGIEISTQAAGFVLAIDSVTFRNLATGATAIHFLSSTFVSTINLANFEDANIGANVSGAALTLNSRITMTGHYGARTGPTYENDPNGLVDWQGYAPYPGCVVTKNVGAGQAFALISDAVASLKANNNPLTGHSCIVIRDGAAYADKVTVEGFTNNGSSISIFTDPAAGARAIINPPPASTAAFRIANASVNVMGIGIVASQNVPYGVWASSAYVTLSSVSVSTSGSLGIYEAGVRISSWSVISYSSVTVWDAHGIWLDGSTMTAVSYSTAVNNSSARDAIFLDGGKNNSFTVVFASNTHASGAGLYALGSDTNTVTQSYMWGGSDGAVLDTGSHYNGISLSTMIGGIYGLLTYQASWNTVTQSYLWGHWVGANLLSGSDYNAISLSTMIGNLYDGLYVNGSDSNTVTQSYMRSGGNGAYLELGSDYNAISFSTMIGNGDIGLYIYGSHSNTVTQSYMWGDSLGAMLEVSDYNALSLSTMIGSSAGGIGLYTVGADSNTVTQSFMWGGLAGAYLGTGADYNAISLSTMIGNSVAGFYVYGSDSNTVTQSYLWGGGNGVFYGTGSDFNMIGLSTMIGNSDSGLYVSLSHWNTVTQSYMLGDYMGGFMDSASDNAISLSTMIGSNGSGLYFDAANSNAVTQSYMWGGGGDGVSLHTGSAYNTIRLSTMISDAAGYPALYVGASSSNSIFSSYIQGSTGAYINRSTGTVIGGSVLVATSTAGIALHMDGGSVNLTLSSSTLTAGSSGAGIYLDSGNSGLILLSTNTLLGARYGMYVAAQNPGTQIWITSNTMLPALSATVDTYGLYINGLITGATIQNNGIYYRTAGGTAGRTYHGLYVQTASGLNIDHNRINEPGMITGGSFKGAYIADTVNASFKFNDVHSTGTSLVNAALLELNASTVTIRNNIFLSSWTVSGSSASLRADASSGFDADYNDWFSSNSLNTAVWGAQTAPFSLGWFGKDGHSISANPLWFNPSAGVEDFHPQSTAGRCTNAPVCSTYASDSSDSPTIDAADGAESSALVALEPTPNGDTANQGSTGETHEASKSPTILGVSLSSSVYDFGTIDLTVANSTVSISSVVVTNTGNVAETYQISAATVTAGSRWILGQTPDIETPVLQALYNSAAPSGAAFNTVATTTITVTGQLSGGAAGRYAGDQNGAATAVRSTRGLWYRLTAPTSTIYQNVQQTIRVTVTATTP